MANRVCTCTVVWLDCWTYSNAVAEHRRCIVGHLCRHDDPGTVEQSDVFIQLYNLHCSTDQNNASQSNTHSVILLDWNYHIPLREKLTICHFNWQKCREFLGIICLLVPVTQQVGCVAVVERWTLTRDFPCPALNLQLTGDHLCR